MLRRRFSDRWNAQETALLGDYLYHITVAEPCGERALNALLQPVLATGGSAGVFAREPLESWLPDLPVQSLTVFGDQDWLYVRDLVDPVVDRLKRSGLCMSVLSLLCCIYLLMYVFRSARLRATVECGTSRVSRQRSGFPCRYRDQFQP